MSDPNMTKEQEQADPQSQAESAEFQVQLGKPRGGARPGAGRKPKWQKAATTVMRVPEAYAGIVRALILHLDETNEIRRGYATATSERLPMRSISNRAQYVQFTVSPRDEPREIQNELNL